MCCVIVCDITKYQSRLVFGVEPTPKLVLHTMVCGIWIGCGWSDTGGAWRSSRLVRVEAVCHSLLSRVVEQANLAWVVFVTWTSGGRRSAIREAIRRLAFLLLRTDTKYFELVCSCRAR